jgi:gamma-glutamylcyclotransferase (GGCT)/AIG2-like uncharacterized protein YtfP
MSWLSTREGDGRLGTAAALVNEALDLVEQKVREADAARCLSEALEEIVAEWSALQTVEEPDAATAFPAMLDQVLGAETQAELLGSAEVRSLLGPEQAPEAESRTRRLERLAGLIRPAGSDHPETGVVVPLQVLLVNLLLDKPDERLVIYGTLAPGRENHGAIADLRGSCHDCTVHGRIDEVDGLPYFTWAPAADSLGVKLFYSHDLPGKWCDLDRFEGSGYKRRLIPATTDRGLCIASIYLSTAEDRWSPPAH